MDDISAQLGLVPDETSHHIEQFSGAKFDQLGRSGIRVFPYRINHHYRVLHWAKIFFRTFKKEVCT